jgi:hypothetical protein
MVIALALRRFIPVSLSLVLFCAIHGCTSTGGMQNVTKESYAQKAPEQVLVLGKVKLRDRGTVGKLTANYPTLIFSPSPGTNVDSKDLFHKTQFSDYFCLLMAPGEYRIVQVRSEFSGLAYEGSLVIPLNVPVKVPAVQAVYIGSILVEYEHKTRLFQMREWLEHKVIVEDRFEEDEKIFRETYPFLPKEITKEVRGPE